MAGFMDAYASGYEATTKVGEDIQASSTLKKAYEQAPDDSTTGAKDMFKVNSLAAQMSAARGNTRAAEKFEKQAEQSSKSNIDNQLNQIKLGQAKLGQLEKTVQMVDSADSGVDAVLKSDMPEDQKMKFIDHFKQMKNADGSTDQKKLEAFKDKFQNSLIEPSDRLSAAQKILKMQLDSELKREGLDIRREGMQLQANIAAGNRDLKEGQNEFMQWQKTQALVTDVDKEIDRKQESIRSLEQKREKGGLSDEEKAANSKDEANVKDEIRKLEKRKKELREGPGKKESKPESKPVPAKTQSDIDKLKPGTKFVWTDGKTYTKD
jgi:hypothetical protein